MSSSDVDDDHPVVLWSLSMESVEVVAGGEELTFTSMNSEVWRAA